MLQNNFISFLIESILDTDTLIIKSWLLWYIGFATEIFKNL